MSRPNIVIVLIFSIVSCVTAFNILTIIKNWSLQDSADFPMPKEFQFTEQLIRQEGFGVETHKVVTTDGYILPITRITPVLNSSGVARPPILMTHGLWASSDSWVLRGKDEDLEISNCGVVLFWRLRSNAKVDITIKIVPCPLEDLLDNLYKYIAYILTNSGYDVWLADMRGNYYARRHKTLSPGEPRFWNFSFHEHGLYDLPVVVEFILDRTRASKIGYIGHSMGTTNFLVFASSRPDYNSKLFGAVLMAPVGANFPMEEVSSTVMRMAFSRMDYIYNFAINGGLYEVLPRTPKMVHNTLKLCSSIPGLYYCLDVLGMAMGEHRLNLNWTKSSAQMAHFPSGASIKLFHHLGQIFNNGFRLYDYGSKLNKLKYNSTTPPHYPIQKITTPVLLIHGINDPWTSFHGVKCLASRLPNAITKVVQDPKFTHVDFLLGLNTNETLTGDILEFLAMSKISETEK